jgi:hypothetical protein
VLAGCGSVLFSARTRPSSPPLAGTTGQRPTIDVAELLEAGRLQAATYQLQRLTFTGTWTYRFRGKTTSVTVSQVPPSTLFSMSDGEEDLTTPNGTYLICAHRRRCPGIVANDPLFTTRGLFVDTELGDALDGFTTTLANAPAGITLKFSHASFAGLHSTCISLFGGPNLSQKWCITSSGVITYGDYAHRHFYLTSFRGSAPYDTSVVPAAARSVTN